MFCTTAKLLIFSYTKCTLQLSRYDNLLKWKGATKLLYLSLSSSMFGELLWNLAPVFAGEKKSKKFFFFPFPSRSFLGSELWLDTPIK